MTEEKIKMYQELVLDIDKWAMRYHKKFGKDADLMRSLSKVVLLLHDRIDEGEYEGYDD